VTGASSDAASRLGRRRPWRRPGGRTRARDGGAGLDPGPARGRRHVIPSSKSRTRLAAYVPLVSAPLASSTLHPCSIATKRFTRCLLLLAPLISALLAVLLANTPAPPSCPCWLSALTVAGPALRVRYGLLGPARGPARLRSAPRARGAAAGGPCPGAWPAPCRYALRARGPGSDLRSAGARRSRTGALPRRAARAPPPRFPGLCARVELSDSSSRLPRRAACAWAHWDRCAALRGPAAFPRWGTGRGRVLPPRAPLGWPVAVGTEGGRVLPLPFVCSWRSTRGQKLPSQLG
jgi:hypothetical protein